MLNKNLDKLARTDLQRFGKSWPAFRVCGYAGLLFAVVLSITLVNRLDLSLRVIAVILTASTLTFLAVAMATKIITGTERLIFYHDFIGVVAVTSALLWLLGQPVLPYLDVTVLGVGAFLACGRVGCLMVGCCHGRPSRLGICYGEAHAAAGFTRHLVGVRLFPVQAVESLWVLCIVLAGCGLIWLNRTPGEATALFVMAYCPARFFFEVARWRPAREYFRGLTQPQWTSPILMTFVAGAELSGVLPLHQWHVVLAACMIATTIYFAVRGGSPKADRYQLLDSGHVTELAEAIEVASRFTTGIHVGCTSLGIKISTGKLKVDTGEIHHYALSCRNESLDEEAAGILAQLILQMKQRAASGELISGGHGLFHLLVRPHAGLFQERIWVAATPKVQETNTSR